MAGTKRRASCRELFKEFNILALIIIICSGQHRKISNKLRCPQYKYKIQDITFMCQTLTSVNIKKEFTILDLSFLIIFPLLSKV
jgi:hypothetical protein